MNLELISVVLLSLSVSSYFYWRRSSALRFRDKFNDKLEKFLSDNETPELLKYIVFEAYSDCLSLKFPFYMVKSLLQRNEERKARRQEVKKIMSSYPENKLREANSLMYRFIASSIINAPITWAFTLFLTVVITSFNSSNASVANALRKTKRNIDDPLLAI